jgi:hypothetical protein
MIQFNPQLFIDNLQRRSLATHVISNVVVQHADDGRSFVVRNVVKNLVNFIWMTNGDFDGMRILQTVEV